MNDDLDEDVVDSEDEFDEFSQKSGLGDTIRQNAFVKIGIVAVVLVTVIFIMIFFSGTKESQNISTLPGGSNVTAVPGTDEEIAPAYVDAVEQQNEAELDRAIAEGGSVIPVPIKTSEARLEAPEVERENEDPLRRWRMLQEERVKRQVKAHQIEEKPVTVLDAEQQSEALKNMSESMVEQMQSILSENTESKTMNSKTFAIHDEKRETGNMNGRYANAEQMRKLKKDAIETKVIIPAGSIYYGQLLLQANSDIPLNVMAQLVSGPLKGWKLFGEFSVMDDAEMLAITFDKAVNDEGKQYSINAIMLNPDTGLPAMRTGIDHRYFERVILPSAASFIEGYSAAVEESGATTVVVNEGTVSKETGESTDKQEVAAGIADVGSRIAEIVDDMSDVEVKIVIDAGTPIGVFFTDNVEEDIEKNI